MGVAQQDNAFLIRILITQGESVVFDNSFDSLPVTIGRSRHCNVCLSQYNWISRQHAVIFPENDHLYLVDLKSSNGIQMAGQTYDRVEIHDGTSIEIGLLSFQFTIENPQREKTALPTSTAPTWVSSGPAPQVIMTQAEDNPESSSSNPPPINARKGRFYPELDTHSEGHLSDELKFNEHSGTDVELELEQNSRSRNHFSSDGPSDQFDPEATIIEEPVAQSLKGNIVSAPSYLRTDQGASGTSPSLTLVGKKSPTRAKPERQRHGYDHGGYSSGGLETYPLERDRSIRGIDRISRNRRVLETYITWKNEVFDTQLFWPGEQVVVGRTIDGVYLPTLKGEFLVARFDGSVARCSLPAKVSGTLRTGEYEPVPLSELIKTQVIPRQGKSFVLKLGATDLCTIDMGKGLRLHMRYAPAPRQLARKRMIEPDSLLKRTMTGSSLVHFILVAFCFLFVPQQDSVKVEEPPRFAKIIVKKEEPKKPDPPPPPPPEEPKVTPPEPRPEPKPKKPPKVTKEKVPPKKKKVIVQKTPPKKRPTPQKSARPTKDEPTVSAPKPAPDITQQGALAALGALGPSTPNPTNQPVAINVDMNAGGGGAKMSTTGVIGSLKSKSGRLQAGGVEGVKTQGKGFGSGSGYGVQGIQGTAGKRGVGGSVVGSPQLMSIKRSEGLDRKQVMEVVKGHLAEIQQCYEKSLLTNPGTAGRVEYEWYISPQGQVKWAKVKKSDIRGGDTLNSCVIAIFKKMKFPVAKNGESTQPNIGFPFGRL